ncbi:enkurin isoform 3-T5 [Salvelinus alpinus]|uniref:enkurin isoform X2 n=1 Tax=Salvelinus alpinus TaxID=8036 RepID=UPI0039FB9683
MPLTWRCSALDRCATRELFENIMAVLRKPQPIYADTKTGDKQLLENSGLVPKYIKKNDFGKNPEYLQQHADEVRRVQDKYESYVNERMYQESRRTGGAAPSVPGTLLSWTPPPRSTARSVWSWR